MHLFLRGEQRFLGSFREKSNFPRISSGVDPFLMEVFRVEMLQSCSILQDKKKRFVLDRGGRGGCCY